MRLRPPVAHRLALVAIVLGAGYLAVSYSVPATEWAVMTDELQTSKLATSVAQTLSPVPRIHGEYYGALSQLYPVLIAPFFGLFSAPAAVTTAHALNALLLAGAAWPAYLLARAVTGSRAAGYAAAALTAFVPWLVLSTTLLTENAAYPAFVWGVWLCYRTLVEPSLARDTAALGGLVLVFFARTQLFVLAVALPFALLAHDTGFALATASRGRRLAALARGARRAVTAHPLLVVAYVAAGAAALATRNSLDRVLGNYGQAAHGDLFPSGIWRAAAVHFDYVVVGVGVAPFLLATAWSLVAVLRPERREAHAFAVLLLALVPLLTLEAASFDLRFTPGAFAQDRYLCYLAPLFAVGAAGALLEGRQRVLSAALVVVLGAAFFWIAGLASYGTGVVVFWASPAAAFHPTLASAASAFGLSLEELVRWGGVVVAAALAAAVWRAPGRATLVVVAGAVAAFGAVEAAYVFDRVAAPATRRARLIEGIRRDWIDARLPAGSSVALVANPRLRPEYWWDAEFWNKTVDRAVSVDGGPTSTPFPVTRLTVDPGTGAVRGREPTSFLVVDGSESRFRFEGTTRLATAGPLALVQVARPYRALWLTQGVTADGWARPGRTVHIRFFAGTRPGARRIVVTLSPFSESRSPQSFTLRSGTTIRRGQASAGRPARVRFTACAPPQGYALANLVTHGVARLPDGRVVGLHVDRVETAAASRTTCRG
ncbi:MAG TPA: hypothetical protein VF101_00460 [Gaiellaceae bacterium]